MRHKRWYVLGFSALALLLLSLLLPARIAEAAHARQQLSPQPGIRPLGLFPCSDVLTARGFVPSEGVIRADWLSGDGGRFSHTYGADTYDFPPVSTLFGYMQVLAFLLLTPSIVLLGYQVMLGASTFRYAGALEGFSHVLFGAGAVAASLTLVRMGIYLENSLATGIVMLHNEQSFPLAAVTGVNDQLVAVTRVLIPYRFLGEPATSYRAVVVPVSRWGCALNGFAGILSPTLVTNLAANIPLMSGLVPLAGTVINMADLVNRLGAMGLALLSMLLCAQVFIRLLLLNYYILVTPLAFGSWALPGGVGPNVVRLWGKGFLSVLFVQVVQLFIVTTIPLLVPTLPFVFRSSEGEGILQTLLMQFPLFLTLSVALMAPACVGASISKALGTAGSVAGAVVVAVRTGVETGRSSIGRKQEISSEEAIKGRRWALTRKARQRNAMDPEEEIIESTRWALTRKARERNGE